MSRSPSHQETRSGSSIRCRSCARAQRSCRTQRTAAAARNQAPSARKCGSAYRPWSRLSLGARHRTSAPVPELFDMKLRALRRDRAARQGPELFLLERAFDDCLDRIALMRRRFGGALLIGCPDPGWPERLRDFADRIDVADPGSIAANTAGGARIVEDAWEPAQASYDLVLAVGTLDT